MQHVLLKDVTSESHQWTVRTRVVRFCEYVSNENPPRTLRIDLILLDEEGKAMEGQIPENWITRFKLQLKEDHVYYIKYFQVRNARSVYRPVDHAYMMRFTAHTKIFEVNPVPENFPLYAHAAVPFDILRNRIGINEFSSDAIGVFTGCSHIKLQNTRGGPKSLRNVYITDGRETASVALWGQHAQSFNAEQYMELGRDQPLVFLFCAMTCRMFDGKLSLQGSTLCKWYANPTLPEVATLQDSCIGRIPAPTWFGPTPGQCEPQRISIAELAAFENPHVIFTNRYIIAAKIKSVVPNQSWWYLACDGCNKTAQPRGSSYKCTATTCTSTSASPRYRLCVIVTDPDPPPTMNEVSTVELVFFGPTAEEIIGAPVDALIASQAGVGAFLPTRITSFYGKIFELRVSVSPASLQRINITYQVDSIIRVANVPLPPSQPVQQAHQEPTILLASGDDSVQRTSEMVPATADATLHEEASESAGAPPPPPQTPVSAQNPHDPATARRLEKSPVIELSNANLGTQKRPLDGSGHKDYEQHSNSDRCIRRKLVLDALPEED